MTLFKKELLKRHNIAVLEIITQIIASIIIIIIIAIIKLRLKLLKSNYKICIINTKNLEIKIRDSKDLQVALPKKFKKAALLLVIIPFLIANLIKRFLIQVTIVILSIKAMAQSIIAMEIFINLLVMNLLVQDLMMNPPPLMIVDYIKDKML